MAADDTRARRDEAEALFQEALKLQRTGENEKAVRLYNRYLDRRPDRSAAWGNLAIALRKTDRFAAAAAASRRAIELDPSSSGLRSTLGNILKDLGRLEESLESHNLAVTAAPKDARVIHNRGIARKEAGDLETALVDFEEACRIEPDLVGAQWDRALVLLQLGRFAEAWEPYESRWGLGELPRRNFDCPRWRGESFADKTLFVYPEQGFGDAILMSRFLPAVKQRGGTLVLECKPPLRRLFTGLEGVDRLTAPGEAVSAIDYQCPIMSLPGALGLETSAIPPPVRLHVPGEAIEKFRPLLAAPESSLKVGIVWSGSLTFKGNRQRAVTLDRFLQLAEIPGVRFFSLQKGELERQIYEAGIQSLIPDIGGKVEDFAETAAVVTLLDLVIMTDSALAHLTGSLGKPLWNLLNAVPYWIYGTAGDRVPWYPSMRLFRQASRGDWDGVFAAVRAALGDAVAAKAEGRWPG